SSVRCLQSLPCGLPRVWALSKTYVYWPACFASVLCSNGNVQLESYQTSHSSLVSLRVKSSARVRFSFVLQSAQCRIR
ncbi:hypothetical protein CC80DRAFT_468066, partial [Byssothecium circinans]